MISPERYWVAENPSLASASTGRGATTGAANTKGSWSDLLTATSFDADLMEVTFWGTNVNGGHNPFLVDFGIDPTGGTTMSVIVPNLLAGAIQLQGPTVLLVPVFIPRGSRVSFRGQANTATSSVTTTIRLFGRGKHRDRLHRGVVTDYGTSTADSTGVTMLTNSASAFGAWQLIGTASRRHSGLFCAVQLADSSTSNATLGLSIGIDPAGGTSYVTVIEEMRVRSTSSETISYISTDALASIPVPSGATIAGRAYSVTSGVATDMDVAVYAF